MKKEEKLGVHGAGVGESWDVWVITFGIADLINDLRPADFNQTITVLVIFIALQLLPLHFPISFCQQGVLEVSDEPENSEGSSFSILQWL